MPECEKRNFCVWKFSIFLLYILDYFSLSILLSHEFSCCARGGLYLGWGWLLCMMGWGLNSWELLFIFILFFCYLLVSLIFFDFFCESIFDMHIADRQWDIQTGSTVSLCVLLGSGIWSLVMVTTVPRAYRALPDETGRLFSGLRPIFSEGLNWINMGWTFVGLMRNLNIIN